MGVWVALSVWVVECMGVWVALGVWARECMGVWVRLRWVFGWISQMTATLLLDPANPSGRVVVGAETLTPGYSEGK